MIISVRITRADVGVVWMVCSNPLDWNENIKTWPFSHIKPWWTYWQTLTNLDIHGNSFKKKYCDNIAGGESVFGFKCLVDSIFE